MPLSRTTIPISVSREAALQKCEEYRSHANIGSRSRLGTIEEVFRYNPNAKSNKEYFLVENLPGVIDLDTKAPAENLKYRECSFWSGCTTSRFEVRALCVFE